MIDESPLYAVLIYGTAFVFVVVHVLINAVMLKDPKTMNRLVAKRGMKTVLSGDNVSWKGHGLVVANIIGAGIMYGSIITVLIFDPLKKLGLYPEPYLAYVYGFIFYFIILIFISKPNTRSNNENL